MDFSNSKKIEIDGHNLTLENIYSVAFSKPGDYCISISDAALEKMNKSNEYIDKIVKSGDTVYGINTGFGALSNTKIETKDLEQLQLNLIRSHCTGVGDPFRTAVTRAIMLLRANCLSSGYSGVTPSVVQLILDFINYGITPIVPKKGSVGASGDLAPLSHIALALIGEGDVEYEGKIIRSDFAIDYIGKTPAKLGPKDGLALINGTAVMAALGALAIVESEKLVRISDVAAAMTLDGVQGTSKAYDLRISHLKPHPGQISSSQNLLKILDGSKILSSHENCGKVQDPYSLRCVPQVHGACRQTLKHCRDVFECELNAVTDNPLIFVEDDDVISGGNFHGEALALAMDYLAMGLAELCNISERRIEKMMNPTFSDLPAFLTKESGLNSGLMIAQVTAAALTSENKYLCHPASVDSIPTSTDKEDHVSMGVTSGRKLHEVVFNLKHTLAIEFLCNCQALDFQKPKKSSVTIDNIHKLIRKHVDFIENDRTFHNDIKKIVDLIHGDEILKTVKMCIGELE